MAGIVISLLCHAFLPHAEARCGSTCNSCTRRYGCMTPSWGKCCTHFFMQNGKRSAVKKSVQNLVEYIKLKREVYPGNEDQLTDRDMQANSLLPMLDRLFPSEGQ